jgi:hypothetical protein
MEHRERGIPMSSAGSALNQATTGTRIFGAWKNGDRPVGTVPEIPGVRCFCSIIIDKNAELLHANSTQANSSDSFATAHQETSVIG